MSKSGVSSLVSIMGGAVFLFLFVGLNATFTIAWNILSYLTHFIPFIITGLICIILGFNEKKFGSSIFAMVFLVLLAISIN